MPWGAVAGAAIAAGGSYLSSSNASKASSAAANAQMQLEREKMARAEAAAGKVPEFRPVTVSSNFGTPQYTYDSSGRLTGVSSQAAPWLADLQKQGQGMSGQYMNLQQQALQNQQGLNASNQAFGAAGSLYGLAGQAMPTNYDTTQATQDYYNQMQGLVAPGREQQLASTRQSLFNKGRQGLAIGATQAGGMAATNPEMAAYYNAAAQEDARMAMQSKSQALADLQARQGMGLGLFQAGLQQTAGGGTALGQYYGNIGAAQSPFTAGMAQLSGMETMQNQPITQGMQYGNYATTQANQIADAYMRAAGMGGSSSLGAIQSQFNADTSNPWGSIVGGLGKTVGSTNWSGLFNNKSGGSGGYTNQVYDAEGIPLTASGEYGFGD